MFGRWCVDLGWLFGMELSCFCYLLLFFFLWWKMVMMFLIGIMNSWLLDLKLIGIVFLGWKSILLYCFNGILLLCLMVVEIVMICLVIVGILVVLGSVILFLVLCFGLFFCIKMWWLIGFMYLKVVWCVLFIEFVVIFLCGVGCLIVLVSCSC